jgi:hypothetical protein
MSRSTSPGRVAARWLPAAAVVGSTALILLPTFRPGYVLRYDMVFGPRMPVGADSLGLGSQLPRSVPSQLMVAAVSHVLPGDVVQKLVLIALLLGAGFGAARLAGAAPLARTGAALAYLWTPYLGERLLLGQWAVLIGWAALPWVVRAGTAVRDEEPGAWPRLAASLGIAGLGGAPAALIVSVPALLSAAWGSRRAPRLLPGTAALLVVYALPWLLPAVLRPGGLAADPLGATVFAPRADTPFGTAASLLTGGGIWNADAVPAVRDSLPGAVGALALLLVGLVGAYLMRSARMLLPLACSAAVGVAVAIATEYPAAARALGDTTIGPLLRDSARLTAPLVLLVAVGFGAAVDKLVKSVARRDGRLRYAAAWAVLLPIAVLPSLAWGVSAALRPVQYPAAYAHLRARLDHVSRPGGVLILPFDAYRRFTWNDGQTVLDPLSQLLARPTITADDLPVLIDGRLRVVRGEDRLALRLQRAARHADLPAAAAAAGVRWVVADTHVPPRFLHGLPASWRSGGLSMWRLRHVDAHRANDPEGPFAPPKVPVIAADIAAAAVLLIALIRAAATLPWRRPRLIPSRADNSSASSAQREAS